MQGSLYAPTAQFWTGRRVLVTGHSGFKGGWLTFWLNRLGAHVAGLSLPPETQPCLFEALDIESLCESHFGDIRDYGSFKRLVTEFAPEIVFHLAAQPLVRRSYAEPLATLETNVMGTVNLLEACRASNDTRAILIVATDKCYANDEEGRAFSEDAPLGGTDPYSASKAAAEIVVHAYRSSFFEGRNLALGSARAGNVIGGGDWSADRLIPDLLRAALSGQPLDIRYPQATRPWQHVLSPLLGYLMQGCALLSGVKEARAPFNFGPYATGVAVIDLVRLFEKHWGTKLDLHLGAADLKEASTLALSPKRARSILDWTPWDDIEAEMAATLEWYRAFHAGAGVQDMRALTETQIALLS